MELCSADSKKRGKNLRDVTESEQTQSMTSPDDESFLRDTMRLLENISRRVRTLKEGSRVPKAGTHKYIAVQCRTVPENSISETQGKGSTLRLRSGQALVVPSGTTKAKGLSPLREHSNG